MKQRLFEALEAFLTPIRERRLELASNPKRVFEIIMDGTGKGRALAQSTMAEVRHAMKIAYKFT